MPWHLHSVPGPGEAVVHFERQPALILKIARPGEVLGLNATASRTLHQTTAKTSQPCQLNFAIREDFRKFLTGHPEAGMQAAIDLSNECQQAYQHLRSFVMS